MLLLSLVLFACQPTKPDTDDTAPASDFSDADGDGYATEVDCDDADAAVNPGAAETWYDGVDQDCDGNDDDQDGDGFDARVDCDDTDPATHPDAGEVPDDGVDQDCDGSDATGGGTTTDDHDSDGYAESVDCDDADADVHPGAIEIWYDGTDQDCDGNDDDQDLDGWARDEDCDDRDPAVHPGAGEVPGDGVDQDCSGADSPATVVDADSDGFAESVDCDDDDPYVHPGAEERWYDGTDQDCDGRDDDQDGDGRNRADDCDDTDPTVYPGAGEVPADGVDQDCDGSDDSIPSAGDADGDGYGESVDCDDGDATVHPDATEVWYDGTDQDCDGADDDQDGDGYPRARDCDDTDPDSHPGAAEVADDDVDQDCDGGDMVSASALVAGELVITEIMKKPSLVDDAYGEWFEVYNASGVRVDLDGLQVSAASLGFSFTVSGPAEIAAGDYAIFAREGDGSINGGLTEDVDYRSDFSLDNDAETITLANGSVTIDSVAYDDLTFFPDLDGASMSVDPAYVDGSDNDNGQIWCDGQAAYGLGDLGSPGSGNPSCSGLNDNDADGYVSAHDCNDSNRNIHPGASETARDGIDSDCDGADYAATSFTSGTLLITEIMQNPDFVADSDGEWFEVYNNTSTTVNLNGLGVGDTLGVQFTVDTDVLVTSGAYAVFAVDSDPLNNGGLPTVDVDYPGTAFTLANSTDAIVLYAGTTRVDTVAYDNGKSFPDPTGASMSLRSTGFSTTRNDTGSYWCESTSYIGGDVTHDRGTPGERNDGC